MSAPAVGRGLLAMTTLVASFCASQSLADVWQPSSRWRIEEGAVAPWADAGTRIDDAYRGREIRFEAARVAAPLPLACEGAHYE